MEMYINKFRARGYLPLTNNANVTFNFTYINLCDPSTPGMSVDYQDTDPASGFPLFLASTAFAAMAPGGIYDQVTSLNLTLLEQKFGISQPFNFIIPPQPLIGAVGTHALLQKVEDAGYAIVIHPLIANQEDVMCDRTLGDPPFATPCAARGLKDGARRYKSTFCVIFSSAENQFAALETFYVQNVKTIATIAVLDTGVSFASLAVTAAGEEAALLNMEIVGDFVIEPDAECSAYSDTCTSLDCDGPPQCAPLREVMNGVHVNQFQHVRNGERHSTAVVRSTPCG
jgi:hypothetical protein